MLPTGLRPRGATTVHREQRALLKQRLQVQAFASQPPFQDVPLSATKVSLQTKGCEQATF